MNPFHQQIKVLLPEQLNQDEKMVSKIHVLPNITIDGIMEYLSVSEEKAEELLNAFASCIEDGHVTHIKGSLNLYRTTISSLGNLQRVGSYLSLGNTPITSLGNLKSVGGDLYLMRTPIKSLGNLQSVGNNLYLPQNQIPEVELHKVQVGGRIVYA